MAAETSHASVSFFVDANQSLHVFCHGWGEALEQAQTLMEAYYEVFEGHGVTIHDCQREDSHGR